MGTLFVSAVVGTSSMIEEDMMLLKEMPQNLAFPATASISLVCYCMRCQYNVSAASIL